MKIAIIVSRFNEIITSALLKGAQEALKNEDTSVFYVPGAFEIPLTAKVLAKSEQWDAIVCLGAVIRGETPHFDLVCQAASQGIQQVMLETEVPIAFGVLTTNTLEEAFNRAGGKMGNVGTSAALTALEMATLLRKTYG